MFKIAHSHPALFLFSLLLLIVLGVIQPLHSSRAEASMIVPQITISLPAGGTQVTGHVGTKVHLSGSGFTPGTFQLYTTTSNDPTKCTATSPGLTPFTPTTATAQNDGTLTVDTTWPASASTVGNAYYICAISSPTSQVLSANTFTVAAPPTVTVTPPVLAAGQQVTISGANWLPPQTLTVAVTFSNAAAVVVSDHALPDHNGNLAATLTIPATTLAGSYAVSVIADNEPTLRVIENNALTVTTTAPITPTATATVSPTPTPTAATTPTATPSVVSATNTPTVTSTPTPQSGPTSSDTTGSTNTFLLFLLGGLGILLVVVGIILFILYSRTR